jgi:hypothetical protein
MPASDVMGLVAAVLLAVPGGRDQYYRFRQWRTMPKGTKLAVFYARIEQSWHDRRDAYNGTDALCTLAGGVLLALTFAFKMGGG